MRNVTRDVCATECILFEDPKYRGRECVAISYRVSEEPFNTISITVYACRANLTFKAYGDGTMVWCGMVNVCDGYLAAEASRSTTCTDVGWVGCEGLRFQI